MCDALYGLTVSAMHAILSLINYWLIYKVRRTFQASLEILTQFSVKHYLVVGNR